MKIHKKDNTIKNQKAVFPEKQFIITFAAEIRGLSREQSDSGCSAVRLARVVRDDEVGGSNPLTPTKQQ
jgi:hypothetical protein